MTKMAESEKSDGETVRHTTNTYSFLQQTFMGAPVCRALTELTC